MIAVISDVHGNYPALKAVVEDIHRQGIDEIISLGDIAGYYCYINECIDLCRENGIINILGNHDYYVTSGEGCPRSFSANVCLKYQIKHIRPDNLEWLKTSVSYIDRENISMRHGGWKDPLDEYLYDFSFDLVKDRNEELFVSGHTHKQILIEENGKTYFNPGSVGQPRDYNPKAAYAFIDNNLNVILKRIEYPINEVIEHMRSCGFLDRMSECLLTGSKIGEFEKK